MRVVCCKCGAKKTIIPCQLKRGHKTKETYICRPCINMDAHMRNQRPANFAAQAKIKMLAGLYQAEKERRLHEEQRMERVALQGLSGREPGPDVVRKEEDAFHAFVSRLQELQEARAEGDLEELPLPES